MNGFRRFLFSMVFCICILVGAFSIYRIVTILYAKEQTEQTYKEIQQEYEYAASMLVNQSEGAPNNPSESPLAGLYSQNNDLIGWLKIEDTAIDYPVLQRKDDPDYYMDHNINGILDGHGAIFAAEACDPEDWDNLILYGHNMRDGTMFAQLAKYQNNDFREKHSTIQYSTLWNTISFHIVCIFKISSDHTSVFPYHTISKFDNMTVNDYLSRAKYYEIWSDGNAIPDGTRILTLSTCEYTLGNGRLVIIAAEDK